MIIRVRRCYVCTGFRGRRNRGQAILTEGYVAARSIRRIVVRICKVFCQF